MYAHSSDHNFTDAVKIVLFLENLPLMSISIPESELDTHPNLVILPVKIHPGGQRKADNGYSGIWDPADVLLAFRLSNNSRGINLKLYDQKLSSIW